MFNGGLKWNHQMKISLFVFEIKVINRPIISASLKAIKSNVAIQSRKKEHIRFSGHFHHIIALLCFSMHVLLDWLFDYYSRLIRTDKLTSNVWTTNFKESGFRNTTHSTNRNTHKFKLTLSSVGYKCYNAT